MFQIKYMDHFLFLVWKDIDGNKVKVFSRAKEKSSLVSRNWQGETFFVTHPLV